MPKSDEVLRDALTKIADMANAAIGPGHSHRAAARGISAQHFIACTPKVLPARLLVRAAKTAVKINPVNAPVFGPVASVALDAIMEPQHIAVLVSKYWGPSARTLTVSFMESTPADLRARIVTHMNAWTDTACISFVETSGTGDVRISRGPGGYWSYLGTDITHIPKNRQTMNLEGFTMNTDESEYRRVVRHETGHTLGFPHEHMRQDLVDRIDPQKAYVYFLQTQGWSQTVVDQQVLTALDEASLMGTPVDETSIMCYQLPGSITRDGQPIVGGLDINQTDYAFAGKIYPQVGASSIRAQHGDWGASEDVDPDVG
jgi:Astacin (Peptidase family M12A)